ncbi:putative tRNA-splicing endonuclease subunit tsp-2 [Colletotrichum chlorophyti]|uniref:tRNA-intron lyase n=1 Tax=Colletotrichum chlorophyti TaxID=708187 RepID=A0A1Q8RRA7_9PEZI|nr:putative tRNA-splicing endonuclease subunit tsp-2 [Colletotrichum chlorophyti]
MSQDKTSASQPTKALASAPQSALGSSTPRPRGPPLHKIYELPAPIRTFPLPSFYPNNPISLFHVLYAWTKQTLFPPPAEPSVVHEGIWSPESKSVNVVKHESMRALWEQGFYGKGNLSRSEPNWLKREQVRRGLVPGQVSELVTASRREERRQMKWERAKSEQEAIRQMRLQEAQLATQDYAVDKINPSPLKPESEELQSKLGVDAVLNGPANHVAEREASTDARPIPEPATVFPKSHLTQSALEVTDDVFTSSPVAKPEATDFPVEESTPVVNGDVAGLVKGTASSTYGGSYLGPARIARPHDYDDGTDEADVIIESETILKPGDVLTAPIPLAWTAPVGPSQLLSLPNSGTSLVTNGIPENTAEGVDIVMDEEVVLCSGDALPATVPASLSAPIGPLELLRLPNSHIVLLATTKQVSTVNGVSVETSDAVDVYPAPISPTVPHKLSTIPEDIDFKNSTRPGSTTGHLIRDLVNNTKGDKEVNGIGLNGATTTTTAAASADSPLTPKPIKRRKSVRFSPKVESTTYQLSDPPSPSHALLNGTNGKATSPPVNDAPLGPSVLETEPTATRTTNSTGEQKSQPEVFSKPTEVVNREHLQLTSEEAFFLAFGLGALRVVDPLTKTPIPSADLFNIFRQYSYFPARAVDELQPDDGFLVNYAVYHHFRSMGWVPRAGIKFGVDWLLYAKGPVFDHAEFGAIILPSYSDQWWKDSDRVLPRKTWHWLHGVVRVLSHVQKSLVLVYVDVPPPPQFDEALKRGPAEVFKLYKIREVMVKRWSSNRNR